MADDECPKEFEAIKPRRTPELELLATSRVFRLMDASNSVVGIYASCNEIENVSGSVNDSQCVVSIEGDGEHGQRAWFSQFKDKHVFAEVVAERMSGAV